MITLQVFSTCWNGLRFGWFADCWPIFKERFKKVLKIFIVLDQSDQMWRFYSQFLAIFGMKCRYFWLLGCFWQFLAIFEKSHLVLRWHTWFLAFLWGLWRLLKRVSPGWGSHAGKPISHRGSFSIATNSTSRISSQRWWGRCNVGPCRWCMTLK